MTQAEALTILKTGANVFLTGEPGSGKTHTINEYIQWLRSSGIEPAVTAATGIAATHVSGMTLHSWSGIGVADHLSPAEIDRIASKEHVARRVGKAKVLIIEEISMLSAATFEAADAVCREVRRVDKPFGGLVVVMVGDFFQLPPVSKNKSAQFAYESNTWRELNPLICYISEQYRQDDADFLEVLSAIRRGEVEEVHYERINARRREHGVRRDDVPRLYSHNADVDRENAAELAKLPAKAKRFLMNSTGSPTGIESLKRGCLSPEVLELKEGARVMFTKNATGGRYVNGTLGSVSGFDAAGYPIVETASGDQIIAEPAEWRIEEEGKVRASITQVPLRLAYAMTVHKSQGMSMDAAVMDLSQAFEYGQGYVALSRVRRLSGVHLLGINQRALEVHPDILEKDRDFRAASTAASDTFETMPPQEIEELQERFIKANAGVLKTDRLVETLAAVRNASTLREAAETRSLTIATILTHLEELQEARRLVEADFSHLLPAPVAQAAILGAWESVGGDKLTPVFKALRGKHSFEDIRLVRLARALA